MLKITPDFDHLDCNMHINGSGGHMWIMRTNLHWFHTHSNGPKMEVY